MSIKKKRVFFIVAAIVFVTVAALLLMPSSDPGPAPETCSFVSVNGLRINTIDRGHGFPLILIHGFGSSNFCWRKNLASLSRHYRVLAPDLPGFGYSDKPLDADYSVAAYAEFIIQFMQKLDIEEAILVGHSLGGGIALLSTLEYPDRVKGLVLIAAEAYPIEEPFMLKISKLPLVKSFIHKALGKYVIRISLKRSYYNQDLVTETVVDRYYAPFLTKNGKAVPIKLLQAMDFAELQAVARQYTSIQKKTLIIWGREDAISGVHLAYKLKADIRNAQLLVLPDSGHLVQEEQPARVNRAIRGFLRREWKDL